ncbi:DUF6351 family protein [Undibacterium sp.]|uniref:DUF6351 family protein n=1 Tax=Undibacterium sp. TaxID=1914977 RepID=UPI00374CBD03
MKQNLRACTLALAMAAPAWMLAGCGGSSNPPAPLADISVRALSSPAEFVTAGSVLLGVDLPAGISPAQVQVAVNGSNVAASFGAGAKAGSLVGVVSGLPAGKSTITVTAANDALTQNHTGSLAVTNVSKTSNVLVAALQPLICRTAALGLLPSTDVDCNAPTMYSFLYKSTDASKTGLQAYDPSHPATDVAKTTTDQGVSVPFIVRDERGVIDRSVYDIAVLFDPIKPWTPAVPQAGWNHKVLWRFGGGCTPGHVQSANTAQAIDNAYNALGKGFAVATSGLSVLGNHCNTVLSAEGVLTVKAHLATTYGNIRYTLSDGSSGGSIQQHGIANNYPGLLNGIIMTGTSFPDPWILASEFADCHLMRNYFSATSPGLWASVAQQAAAMGKPDLSTCMSVDTNFFGLGYAFEKVGYDPTMGCTFPDNAAPPTFSGTVPAPGVYDPVTNPGGVRCTIQDALVSILGKRASDGFANRPYDNAGVQYGLAALKSGAISVTQFIDLNQKIGGIDIDNNFIAQRSVADTAALAPLYKSGQIIDAKQLGNTPIIAYQSYNNQIFHDTFYNWAIRARLMTANGNATNQAIWTFLGSPGTFADDAFTAMDQWLAKIEADTSTGTAAAKLAANKPAAAADACLISGNKVTDAATCAAQFPNHSDPRIVAGSDITDMVIKCQLKPVSAGDYGVAVTADQLAQLQTIFPAGVCDYSKQGVGQQANVPWLTWL